MQIVLLQFGNLALIFVVVEQFSALAGWSFAQIMFLLALRLLSHGLYVTFALEVSGSLAQYIYILRGEFDRFLLESVRLVDFGAKRCNWVFDGLGAGRWSSE